MPEASSDWSSGTFGKEYMNLLRLCFFVLIIVGCATTTPKPIHEWTDLKMPGLILDLKDPKYVEWYGFNAHNSLCATLGVRDGMLCGPAYQWKAKNDLLIISNYDGKIIETLRLIEVRPHEVVTSKSAGVQAIYSIKRL